ncbi:MAG: hypothetical protein R3C28_31935 [Pirellulaceae bacterium]
MNDELEHDQLDDSDKAESGNSAESAGSQPQRSRAVPCADSVRLWWDLLRVNERFLYANFVRQYGPEGAKDAMREWLHQRNEEHTKHLLSYIGKLGGPNFQREKEAEE